MNTHDEQYGAMQEDANTNYEDPNHPIWTAWLYEPPGKGCYVVGVLLVLLLLGLTAGAWLWGDTPAANDSASEPNQHAPITMTFPVDPCNPRVWTVVTPPYDYPISDQIDVYTNLNNARNRIEALEARDYAAELAEILTEEANDIILAADDWAINPDEMLSLRFYGADGAVWAISDNDYAWLLGLTIEQGEVFQGQWDEFIARVRKLEGE